MKIKIFIITLISFLILNHNSFSKNIEFTGLSKLKINDLQSLTKIDLTKKKYSSDEIDKIIKDLYLSELIYQVDYKYINDQLIFEIEESKIINKVYINGNIRINDDILLNNILSKDKTLISKNKIKNDIALINNIYNSDGFKDVYVISKTEKFSKDRVNLIFEINEGEKYKINNIKFFGNKNFSDRYLSSLIATKKINFYNIFNQGSNFSKDIFDFDKSKIINFYKQKGFFDIEISHTLENNSFGLYQLHFYINEGTRYKVSKISYDNEIANHPLITENFIKSFENEFYKKKYFDMDLIDEYLFDINKYLISQNILDFSIDLNYLKKDNIVDLSFISIKQDPVVINKINIFGNNITKDNILRSKLSIEPGDNFNNYLIENSKNTLNRLPYINTVNSESEFDENTANINFIINENDKTGNLLASATYDADTQLGFNFGIDDKNFLGTGNEIDANIATNSENIKFNLEYVQYPISKPLLSNIYNIYNEEIDYLDSFGYEASKKGLSYSIIFSENDKLNYKFKLGYENFRGKNPKNNSISQISDNISTFDNFSTSFSISYDSRDDYLYPRSGFFNNFTFLVSPKDLSDDAYYKLNFTNKNYFKMKDSNNYIFNVNNFGFADSLVGNLRTINAYSLGGNNFKGFDYRGIGPNSNNYYLGGNKFFTSTVGYGSSFIFDEKDNINLKLFFTAGSIWGSDYISSNDYKLRSSAGISFDLLTQIGPISLTYASPILKENGDDPRNFTFSIGTSF